MSDEIVLRRGTSAYKVSRMAAKDLITAVEALQNNGRTVTPDGYVRLVLTGGTIGIAMLKEVAALDHAASLSADTFPIPRIDWKKIHIFFGDERYLPADSDQRNDNQAHEVLFSQVDIPAENIHRMPAATTDTPAEGEVEGELFGNGPLDQAARDYQETVQEFAPDGFDIHLLGMGQEGHINSLFPETLALAEKDALVVPVRHSPKFPPNRVSLSLLATNSSKEIRFLVTGADKTEALRHISDQNNVTQWPCAGARGAKTTLVYADVDAVPSHEIIS